MAVMEFDSEQTTHEIFEKIYSDWVTYRMSFTFMLLTLILKMHSDLSLREVLSISHLMNKNQQVMYKTITDNLDEGVIVKSTLTGLHFFN